MLKTYQNQLKVLEKRSNKVKTDDLSALEDILRENQLAIRNLKQEIKDLDFVRRKQEKVIQKKKKYEDGLKLTKIID